MNPTETLHLWVDGTPAPQGSKRHVGGGVLIESSKQVKPWRAAIADAARDTGIAGRNLNGCIALRVQFYLKRPAGHFRKDGTLKPSAPDRPSVKPDTDKLLRSTMDGLGKEANVYTDDARVVSLRADKWYCGEHTRRTPGADIQVTQL